MDEFVKKGYIDIFRELHPDEEGHYTWWTYRGDCRKEILVGELTTFLSQRKLGHG